MPRLRDLFPAIAGDPRLAVPWDKAASIDPGTGLPKDVLVIEMLVREVPDPDALHELAGLFHRDLVAMKTSASPHACHIVNFIQFRLATFAASAFTGIGATQWVYDWLVRSVVDDEAVSGTLDFFLPRIPEFLVSSEPNVSQDATRVVLSWCSSYFYYSHHQRALGDLVANNKWLLVVLERLLFTSLPRSLLPLLLYLEWTVTLAPACTDRVLQTVENLYERMPFDRRSNKNLGVTLAVTTAPHARHAGPDIAARMLRDYADVLKPHEPIQLRVRALAAEPMALHGSLHLLVNDLRSFNRRLMERSLPDQPHVLTDMRSRVFGIITPALTTLLHAGYCRDAQALLAAWRDMPEERTRSDPGLVLIPIHRGGCFAAVEGASSWPHEDTVSDPSGLMHAMNAFLGTTIVLTGDVEFKLVAPPRGYGVPNASAAPAFAAAFLRELNVDRIARLVAEPGENEIPCITVLPGGQWPIQPLLLRELGWTRPLAKSLEAPAIDRRLRSALLVVASSYQAEAECDAVRGILERAGIEVTVLGRDAATSQAVLRLYSSDLYDLVWIISHGEFSHFEAHTGGISVADGYLSYGDLRAAAIPDAGRRLLFLNLCDGGATGWRGLHEVGIGAAACTAHQC